MSGQRLTGSLADEPGLQALGVALDGVAGRAGEGREMIRLKRGVYRVIVGTGSRSRTLIAKRLSPPTAHRNELTLERWLPQAGLAHLAPALVAVAAEGSAGNVWHLYEDLGELTLAHTAGDRRVLEAAVRAIANLHARFAHQPMLAGCRVAGEDHGFDFYDTSVRDALTAVTAVLDGCDSRSWNAAAGRRLLARLERLLAQSDVAASALADLGGPDTLLHGDLWLDNVSVLPGAEAYRIRLMDWDHVGPGSFSYDLSTLAFRFAPGARAQVVDLYRRAVAEHDIVVPTDDELRVLFTTAECARLANVAIWPARAAAADGSRWALDELAAIDDWFDAVQTRCGV